MILNLAIAGYRSLRDLVVPLDKLTIITGANGTGKSSLYKAIRLLADVAQGRAIRALAREGGLPSTLWAGPEAFSRAMKKGEVPVQGGPRKKVVALKLGFASEDYGYAIDLGLPPPKGPGVPAQQAPFALDPQIKTEVLWAGEYLKRSNEIAARRGPLVQILGQDGSRRQVMTNLADFDSMMTHAADPKAAPELLYLRDLMRDWRFYDHFRTDPEAVARQPQIGTYTPALASDGSDVAAALQTVRLIGNPNALDAAVDDAFPGAHIEIQSHEGVFELTMHQQGLLRPLKASELSDGTLRYLLLIAALMTPRVPPLLVLNEPETSLHPSLLPPLARLIEQCAERTQIILVSHAQELVQSFTGAVPTMHHRLEKQLGETVIADLEHVKWEWPKR